MEGKVYSLFALHHPAAHTFWCNVCFPQQHDAVGSETASAQSLQQVTSWSWSPSICVLCSQSFPAELLRGQWFPDLHL